MECKGERERESSYVESNVPILADPSKEELNTTIRLDLRLVSVTLGDEVLGVSVEDVDIFGRDVN